ncbi:hypothetical protein SISSUDRAFT_1067412 [Sistotremastrum suecicum HHB10207 ss-3]|uniref:Uncharacterized protein n=1 Tax=Sistotremastrum suecicum HHB10207 ss-3 TaxID=1314776 RepID=A0A165X5L8_9AGAM|nr:hypothetical protein SISSUDRAFT_1067412 [Sistotremastrum suecicum HHB10207 ss-3]
MAARFAMICVFAFGVQAHPLILSDIVGWIDAEVGGSTSISPTYTTEVPSGTVRPSSPLFKANKNPGHVIASEVAIYSFPFDFKSIK